jgi:hypothetical protein
MYTLIKSVPLSKLLVMQAPVLIISLLIAETFYKFHSFLLESIAFLATWFVIDLVVSFLMEKLKRISLIDNVALAHCNGLKPAVPPEKLGSV